MDDTLYVGTYTQQTASEGVYLCRFDPATGRGRVISAAGGCDNPSFLATGNGMVYAACELEHTGRLAAYRILPDQALALVNTVDIPGSGTCHVQLGRDGSVLYAANYASGHLAACPVLPDGSLGEPIWSVQHQGKGVNPQRQEHQHAHSVNVSPDGRFVLAADLGMDCIVNYAVHPGTGALSPNPAQDRIPVEPGQGPRHMAFHPDGKHAYLACEMGNTVTAYRWEVDRGVLTPLRTLSMLPEGFGGFSSAADIHVSPDGRFLYASNRGHDSIAVYRLDGDGLPELVAVSPCHGKEPRNFCLDPQGKFLVVAHQNSDSLAFCPRDPETGLFDDPACVLEIPKPVCVLWP